MTREPVDPQDFWNEKILTWESDRYKGGTAKTGWLERLANRNSGLQARMQFAREILLPAASGKRVVELGCGSGLLAEEIIAVGATSYRGFDISDKAVASASARMDQAGFGEQARFAVLDVGSLEDLEADLVFSLGLLDWLDPQQLDAVIRAGGQAGFLHSFSERRPSFWRFAHKLYVYVAYGHETGAYRPRYHSAAELEAVAAAHGQPKVRFVRNKRMRFGTFVTTLGA